MRPRRDERFAIRISRAEKRALGKLALERDVTAAQIIRHAIKRELASHGESRK
jgi:predicted transcriptional regulator